MSTQSPPGPISTRRYGHLPVATFADGAGLGARAAADLAPVIGASIAQRGLASLIVATGNSQLQFMAALRQRRDIDWGKVLIFHMDEYLGMSEDHPASFRRYLRQNLVNWVNPRAFYGIDGEAQDVAAEMQRYRDLLAQHPPDACIMGIGENGHLAFNDPPADFHTAEVIHIVKLDEACRRQQVGEGHFPTLADVPTEALSLTVPALLAPRQVLVIVPERRKAPAVKAALEGPITPACPASILQEQAHARLYLDSESASLLSP
jgi:glucosamine-6-phosphate deaminase